MTFTPCEHCPGGIVCDLKRAQRRATRGACEADVHPPARGLRPDNGSTGEALLGDEEALREEEPRLCAEETRPATTVDPPEFCEALAVEGSDYCDGHDPDAALDAAERRAEEDRDRKWEEEWLG